MDYLKILPTDPFSELGLYIKYLKALDSVIVSSPSFMQRIPAACWNLETGKATLPGRSDCIILLSSLTLSSLRCGALNKGEPIT